MTTNRSNIPTRFLSAERNTPEEIARARDELLRKPLLLTVLDCIPVITLLLNVDRQVVMMNRAMHSIIDSAGLDDLVGLRPGELLECVHSAETTGGCGTTDFCRVCGAANAILSTQNGSADVRECRIIRRNHEALDLRVWTSLFRVDDENYTFFSMLDITDEKRRLSLERIFFHDVMNSVSAVLAAAEILKDVNSTEKDRVAEIIISAGKRIVEEISTQKDLTAAETGELTVKTEPVNTLTILNELGALYEKNELAKGKMLNVAADTASIEIISDYRLLFRVLGNMVKNAIEASYAGDTVTLKAERAGENIRFSVNNPGLIPEEIRLQIFQRSFTTKGGGRGLGTYSMKLLSERYLKGTVFFTTTERDGTTFYAEYPITPG